MEEFLGGRIETWKGQMSVLFMGQLVGGHETLFMLPIIKRHQEKISLRLYGTIMKHFISNPKINIIKLDG